MVKSFNQGDPTPQVRFLHSKVTPNGLEQTHYEDFIDYLSDAGEKWRATIHYNPSTGAFSFNHCKGGTGECHDDVIMNYRNLSGENRQLTIENCSLQQFQSNSELIKLNSKFLGKWDAAKTDDRRYTGIVYISWKASEKCGCSSLGGGFKHYLYNTTGDRYKVTVQTITYASPSYTSSHDYIIKPGEEIYVGCSQSGSQGCFSVDFTITNRVKL